VAALVLAANGGVSAEVIGLAAALEVGDDSASGDLAFCCVQAVEDVLAVLCVLSGPRENEGYRRVPRHVN